MSKPSYTHEVEQRVITLITNGRYFINAAREVGVSYKVVRNIAKKNNLRSSFSPIGQIRALLKANPNIEATRRVRSNAAQIERKKIFLEKRKKREQARVQTLIEKRGKQFLNILQAGHTIKAAAWICGISVGIGKIIIAQEKAVQAKAPHKPGKRSAARSANPCVPN